MVIAIMLFLISHKEHCPHKQAERAAAPDADDTIRKAPIKGKMNRLNTLCIVGALALLTAAGATAQDGAAIFRQNCTACHKMGTRLVGPDLTGVTEKRSDEWLRKFIRGSQAMIKAGDKDAVAIFEEFNKMPMTDFALSDAEMTAVLDYLASFSKKAEAAGDAAEAAPQEEAVPIVYTEEDVALGRAYFQGGLSGGGPSCVSCHNASAEGVIPGGTMAKDLTNVYARMGHAGIAGILGAPPFPAMTSSYSGSAALTEEEIHALAAFFEYTDKSAVTAEAGGMGTMLMWGFIGLVVILLWVAIVWRDRLKKSVRHEIDGRQLRSI